MTVAVATFNPTRTAGSNQMADFNVKQVAERLEISGRTILRMIHGGHFPSAYKVNPFAARRSEWRIKEDDIEAVERKREEQQKNSRSA